MCIAEGGVNVVKQLMLWCLGDKCMEADRNCLESGGTVMMWVKKERRGWRKPKSKVIENEKVVGVREEDAEENVMEEDELLWRPRH